MGDGKEWDENEFMMMKVHDITKSMKSISHIVSVAYTKCEYTRTDTTVTLTVLSCPCKSAVETLPILMIDTAPPLLEIAKAW